MFISFARFAIVLGGAAAVPLALQAAPPELPPPSVPTVQVPAAQVPTDQVPTAQVPTDQVPRVQVPTDPQPADEAVTYVPPVRAVVVDAFRPPDTFAGAGNRGLEYGAVPGQSIVASAPGTVVFAGQVGGSNHITIGHADGLRTSYSQLDRIDVRVGDVVTGQQHLGTAGSGLHFGVRVGDTYLDPAALLSASAMSPTRSAHLVPVEG